jgi:hypothetical protein
MTDLDLIGDEMTLESNNVTEPSVVDVSAQVPPTPVPPVTPELPSNSTVEAQVLAEPEPAAVEKAPASRRNQAAAKKPAAKKVSKAKSVKPVISKSPAKKAAAKKVGGKTPAPQKKSSAKTSATKKSAVKKATTAKKTTAKKAITKKSRPLKAEAAKAVVAPPQAPKAAEPAAPTTPLKKTTSRELARGADKAKAKLVRDSFTMPEQDFGLVAVLKDRALGFKRPVKKSELLRAGLHALQQLTDAQLRGALDSLMPLKPGRPKKKGN